MFILAAWQCPAVARAQTPLSTTPGVSPTFPPSSIANPNVAVGGGSVLSLPRAASVQLTSASTPVAPAAARADAASSLPSASASDMPAATPAAAVPLAQTLQVSAADLFSPISLPVPPPLTTVTLTYNVACAGAPVLVVPLDGGQINGAAGGATIKVGADGTLAFSFQAPSGPGRYHVMTRSANAEMALRFDVASPAAATSAP